MDAAELGDGVIAVFEEDLVVEFLGASKPDRRVDGLVTLDVEFSRTPSRRVDAGSAQFVNNAQQGAFHNLGQVDEGKDGLVEVREVPTEDIGFFGGELFGDVDRHRVETLGGARNAPRMRVAGLAAGQTVDERERHGQRTVDDARSLPRVRRTSNSGVWIGVPSGATLIMG